MTKLYMIKRELITKDIRRLRPNATNAKFPLRWWLKNYIASEDELEECDNKSKK